MSLEKSNFCSLSRFFLTYNYQTLRNLACTSHFCYNIDFSHLIPNRRLCLFFKCINVWSICIPIRCREQEGTLCSCWGSQYVPLCQAVFCYMWECDKKLFSFSTHHILLHNTPQWLSTLAEGDIWREFAFSRVISKLCCEKSPKHIFEFSSKSLNSFSLSPLSSLYIFLLFSLATSNYIARSF